MICLCPSFRWSGFALFVFFLRLITFSSCCVLFRIPSSLRDLAFFVFLSTFAFLSSSQGSFVVAPSFFLPFSWQETSPTSGGTFLIVVFVFRFMFFEHHPLPSLGSCTSLSPSFCNISCDGLAFDSPTNSLIASYSNGMSYTKSILQRFCVVDLSSFFGPASLLAPSHPLPVLLSFSSQSSSSSSSSTLLFGLVQVLGHGVRCSVDGVGPSVRSVLSVFFPLDLVFFFVFALFPPLLFTVLRKCHDSR